MSILKALYTGFIAVVLARIFLWLLGEVMLIIFPDLTVSFGRFFFAWIVLALFFAFAQLLIEWDMKHENDGEIPESAYKN